ncbi:flagellar basal body L-ring protein FlgH [Sphingomonas sp. Leaf20]|uniref:flagellar basal body L-ring protein FlgH n=1 Tax=Sphingomonas sp. Leaf20 TaxID=1735685 RepID=UPI0006FADCF5|nr:flagellar basal body L-ring protein FlgH [Sphingomonas sp. Leaf20]KQM72343.1 flagellar biosynthesis protein FlgH [Sphingomonas sp. Leaf20]
MTRTSTLLLILAGATAVSGCGTLGQLKTIGKAPKLSEMTAVDTPLTEDSLGQPRRREPPPAMAALPPDASLFRAGAGAFLGDQRASHKGDILTVRINVADRAEVGNTTARTRGGSENAGLSAALGLGIAKPDPLIAGSSKSQFNGSGNISRSETISMTMSAIVTDVLPNGNLMIRGRQEIRVNYELRELIVTGMVRPQDIGRDNSIRHTQIAEARISYGGRGQLTQAQQARWGQQIYDALFPF